MNFPDKNNDSVDLSNRTKSLLQAPISRVGAIQRHTSHPVQTFKT